MLWNKKVEEEDKLPDLPFQSSQIKNTQETQIFENSDSEEEHFESIKTSEKQSLPSFPDSPIKKGFSQAAIKEAVSSEDNEKIPLPPAEDELSSLSNSLKTQKQNLPLGQPDPQKSMFIQPNPFLNESIITEKIIEKKVEPQAVTKMKSESKPIKLVSVPDNYREDAPHPPALNRGSQIRPEKPIPVFTRSPEYKKEEYDNSKEYAKDEEKNRSSSEKTTDVFVKIDKFYSAKKALTAIKQDVKEIENLLTKIRETKMKEERELSDWEKNISSVKAEISNINDSLFEKTI